MRLRRLLALGITMLTVLISGCWNMMEINQRTIFLALGFDAAEGGSLAPHRL